MVLNFKEIVTATMVLFAVIDIIGNIPIIIGLREKAGHINSGKASVIAAIVMIVFLFLGESILKLICGSGRAYTFLYCLRNDSGRHTF